MSDIIVKEKLSDVRYVRKDEIIVDERQHTYVKRALGREIYSSLTWMYSRYRYDIPKIAGIGRGLVNAYRVNDIFQINKFFEKANRKLDTGQYFVICLETKHARKQRILNRFPKILSYPWYCWDFLVKRVLPKMDTTRNLFFRLTRGYNRVLSLTEALGRLVCCGFEIVEFEHMGDLTCIISRKERDPVYDRRPKHGALIGLNRIGEGGKMFTVFKMRTMHPYSEYLQDFIFENYDLQTGGKFKNDFRLTNWGRFFRKYWIDELPMFINWFRGELKLVGVRPLSRHYFELYPEELRERRINVKPGLIPPYYADMPEGFEEILESERNYLTSFEKNPYLTDLRYFFRVFANIMFRGARSK